MKEQSLFTLSSRNGIERANKTRPNPSLRTLILGQVRRRLRTDPLPRLKILSTRLIPKILVGLVGIEPTTTALSTVVTNHEIQPVPDWLEPQSLRLITDSSVCCYYEQPIGCGCLIPEVSRKEVIQPQVPLRLLVDFTPVTGIPWCALRLGCPLRYPRSPMV